MAVRLRRRVAIMGSRAKGRIDYSNMENTVKTLFPEYMSLCTLGPTGQLPTMAQAALGRTLKDGITPKGEIPPFQMNILLARGKK